MQDEVPSEPSDYFLDIHGGIYIDYNLPSKLYTFELETFCSNMLGREQHINHVAQLIDYPDVIVHASMRYTHTHTHTHTHILGG